MKKNTQDLVLPSNFGQFAKEFTLRYLKYDLPASLAVFLVAVPLCLGIAHASGTPLLSGLITGIVGGIIVGALSKSPLSVSGPAAGLTAIVAAAAMQLKSFEALLVAVVLAGLMQIGMGLLKAGAIGKYIPASVIKGMLAAIGIILILKQLPHLMGYDAEVQGSEKFQVNPTDFENVPHVDHGHGNNTTFTVLIDAFTNYQTEILLIGLASLLIIVFWDKTFGKRFKLIPSSLIAVIGGTLMAVAYSFVNPSLKLGVTHLVQVPAINSWSDFVAQSAFPMWSALSNPQVYISALTIALVASIETLLSIEAIDKLDPQKRRTPVNRELVAQGVGNSVSGLIGGIPMTSVIVRSSVNLVAGGRTKLSAILHGSFILIAILLASPIINLIPLATLSAVLIMTGFKLASPKVFKSIYKQGLDQFIPFLITIVAIVLTDLLIGVLVGVAVSAVFILRNHYKTPVVRVTEQGAIKQVELGENLTFLNKTQVIHVLEGLPARSHVVIDGSRSLYIDHDIREVLEDFIVNATEREIRVESIRVPGMEHTSQGLANFYRKLEAQASGDASPVPVEAGAH
jgi:carbonic anhydrase